MTRDSSKRACLLRSSGPAAALFAAAFACAGALSLSVQAAAATDAAPQNVQFDTTVSYLTHFYPLWFTTNQAKPANRNRLAGPVRVSPLYQTVVAINVDTFYASTTLNLSSGPAVLTIPNMNISYSALVLDYYGDTFPQGTTLKTPGTYALTPPGFNGKLPGKVTPLAMPLNTTVLIFRTDKYSSTGVNQEKTAEQFRKSIQIQSLKSWLLHQPAPATRIVPELVFAKPYKTIADAMVAQNPIKFLTQLQGSVHSASTPPMTPGEQDLSNAFDKLFAQPGDQSQFALGAQKAHSLILERYLTHTDKNNWITFDNMGTWGPHEDLDRSAITEFIQYGNNHAAAAYYQAFKDAAGAPLDGANSSVYILHIPKDQIPQAQRFWSFTAYTPQAIELVRNSAKKYVVASYTPGLHYENDGSVTIYMSKVQPPKVDAANWLPAPSGPFNVMLRVYGPQGSVADNTYVPPPIVRQ